MRVIDLIRSAVGGLWQQKVRTALTLTGVAVGASSLAFSLSLGVGLRGMIDREFKSRPGFWEIEVQPSRAGKAVEPTGEQVEVQGDLSSERKARLRETLVERYQMLEGRNDPLPLTPEVVAQIAALPDVAAINTTRLQFGWAYRGERSTDAQVVSGSLGAPTLQDRLIAGRFPTDSDRPEAVVSELTLYELGVRDEAAFAAALGSQIELEFGADARGHRQRILANMLAGGPTAELTPRELSAVGKLFTQMPRLIDESNLSTEEKADLAQLISGNRKPSGMIPRSKRGRGLAAGTFTIVGILRPSTPADGEDGREWIYRYGSVFITTAAAEPIFRQLPGHEDGHFDSVQVRITPGGDLPAIVKSIEDLGFQTYSSLKWFAAAKQQVTAIAAGLNVFALISLLVAALGITNTLVTSVVERTKEIGILKALGARDGPVMWLFLLEGALIGLLGGILGLAIARLAAIPADALVKRLVEEQAQGNKLLTESVFEFPLWLSTATILFAAGVTTLAALYPARRAARVHPVEALRHE